MIAQWERAGELVKHGLDIGRQPDSVTFVARSGEAKADWLVEVRVSLSGWATRDGRAQLFEANGEGWELLATALPFDALYLRPGAEARIVFGQFIQLTPGRRYMLHLPNAAVAKSAIGVSSQVREPELVTRPKRRGWASRRPS